MPHIDDFLSSLSSHSFHMPGHKRNADTFPALPLQKDITEIEGADNLHRPIGIIGRSMEEAARLWGAYRSFYLVNGSTCGILAGLATLCRRGDKVLVARNCHRSVFHGLELLGLRPTYVLPEYIEGVGVYGAIAVETVREALEKEADIRTLVLTSPSYEGLISDLPAICALCHSKGVKVLIDAAHGAHLDLSPYFVGGSVAAGADISVQSLHKTLPALTQTAILHASEGVDIARLMHSLRVFETSSPSYLLMQSAEHSVEMVKRAELFEAWINSIREFENEAKELKHIKLALRDRAHDPSKLVLVGVNGHSLAKVLRRHSIEPEYEAEGHLVAMTGMGNTKADYAALIKALKEADALLPPKSGGFAPPPYCYGDTVCGIEEAMNMPSEAVAIEKCIGRVAAEYVWAYPPGIPMLIPGERIGEEFLRANPDVLESDSLLLPEAIKVLL